MEKGATTEATGPKKDCRISEKSVKNGRRLHGKHPQNGFSDHEAMLPERR
jgi:hypothetical protein